MCVGEARGCEIIGGGVVHGGAWCGEAGGVGGVRRGGGERLHYVMNAVIGVLKLHSHGAHYAMDVSSMGLECVGGGLNAHIRVEVNVVGEGG